MNLFFTAFRNTLSKPLVIMGLYITVAAVATLVKISIDFKPHDPADYISKVNNFTIYRNSFWHLVSHQNLYGYFPAEQYDEFLYSPTFALFVAPFALLPKYVGVVIWCMFNALMVFYAIRLLPVSDPKKLFIHWFILIELITSIQNQQVNVLVMALFVFTFVAFERKQIWLAALIIALSTFIKLYGILGASLFLLYPDKWKFIGYGLLWAALLWLSPVVVISFNELIVLYQNWFNTLVGDHAINQDISVMRMLGGIFKPARYEVMLSIVQLMAIVLFCVKYIRVKAYSHDTFRALFLASVMIWSVIFSHAAESSTYIIAVCGVGIWYIYSEQNKWNLALLIFVCVLTILSPTDIFPRAIRTNYVVPFALKSLPCLLIWIKCEYDMLFRRDLIEQTVIINE
jgi:hypothetical protein